MFACDVLRYGLLAATVLFVVFPAEVRCDKKLHTITECNNGIKRKGVETHTQQSTALSSYLEDTPEFKRCKRNDDQFSACLKEAYLDSLEHLRSAKERVNCFVFQQKHGERFSTSKRLEEKKRQGEGPVQTTTDSQQELLPNIVVATATARNTNLGIPNLEPLFIPESSLGQGNENSPIKFITHLTDINVYNITKQLVKKISMDFDTYEFNIEGVVSDLIAFANYKMDGKFLFVPIKNEGSGLVGLRDVDAYARAKNEKYEKNGKEYLRLKDFKFYVNSVSHAYADFTSTVGDKAIDATINKLVNENWRELWRVMLQPLIDTLEYVFQECFRRVFERIPLEEIFPSS